MVLGWRVRLGLNYGLDGLGDRPGYIIYMVGTWIGLDVMVPSLGGEQGQ